MACIVIGILGLIASSLVPGIAIISQEEFMSKFNKTYENEDENTKRTKIFQDNINIMEKHNKLYKSGESSFMMGVNKYSDMTYDEVVSELTGDIDNISNDLHKRNKRAAYKSYIPTNIGEEPNSKDYRGMDALNPVKDQDKCGSCWAFAAAGSIESQIFLRTGKKVQLSEQYLVDCSRGYGFPSDSESGCDGGWSYGAIEFVGNNGIALEDTYPYTKKGGTCNKDLSKTTHKVKGMQRVKPYTDADLLNAVERMGPVKVSIMLTDNTRFFKDGVLFDNLCTIGNDSKTNHAVILVGYGTEQHGQKCQKYWLIRNSWGESYGVEGYLKLSRDVNNHCQVSSKAYIPIIEVETAPPVYIPESDGCIFGDEVTSNGFFLTETCLKFQCNEGTWIYHGISEENCGNCQVDGYTKVHTWTDTTPSSVVYELGLTGNFSIAQPGRMENPLYGVKGGFGSCLDPGAVETCIKNITYHELGIEIELVITPDHCTGDACNIEVRLDDKIVPVDTTVKTLFGRYGAILVFQAAEMTRSEDVNCINIVGTTGFSMSLCTVMNNFPHLYIWAIPSLRTTSSTLYGLCNMYSDASQNQLDYRKKGEFVSASLCKDIKPKSGIQCVNFANSWKVQEPNMVLDS